MKYFTKIYWKSWWRPNIFNFNNECNIIGFMNVINHRERRFWIVYRYFTHAGIWARRAPRSHCLILLSPPSPSPYTLFFFFSFFFLKCQLIWTDVPRSWYRCALWCYDPLTFSFFQPYASQPPITTKCNRWYLSYNSIRHKLAILTLQWLYSLLRLPYGQDHNLVAVAPEEWNQVVFHFLPVNRVQHLQ